MAKKKTVRKKVSRKKKGRSSVLTIKLDEVLTNKLSALKSSQLVNTSAGMIKRMIMNYGDMVEANKELHNDVRNLKAELSNIKCCIAEYVDAEKNLRSTVE